MRKCAYSEERASHSQDLFSGDLLDHLDDGGNDLVLFEKERGRTIRVSKKEEKERTSGLVK